MQKGLPECQALSEGPLGRWAGFREDGFVQRDGAKGKGTCRAGKPKYFCDREGRNPLRGGDWDCGYKQSPVPAINEDLA